MANPAPADPWEIAVVAGLLGLPFAAKADQLRRRVTGGSSSVNGQDPDAERAQR